MHICSLFIDLCGCVCGVRERERENAEFPVSAAVHGIDVLNDSASRELTMQTQVHLYWATISQPVCVCTLPFPSVWLYNPNQLHMLSRCVCGVCECWHRSCPRCFVSGQQGSWNGWIGRGACRVFVPKPVFFTHSPLYTSKGVGCRSVQEKTQIVAEISIAQYPLRLL